jgi:hypothetical protein
MAALRCSLVSFLPNSSNRRGFLRTDSQRRRWELIHWGAKVPMEEVDLRGEGGEEGGQGLPTLN